MTSVSRCNERVEHLLIFTVLAFNQPMTAGKFEIAVLILLKNFSRLIFL